MDIAYILIAKGFVYLAAVIDWFSRWVLAWRVSISMEVDFCLDAVEEALANYGKPDIFNTDQGSQFSSAAFTGGVLLDNGIAIGMDGRPDAGPSLLYPLAVSTGGRLSFAAAVGLSLRSGYARTARHSDSSTLRNQLAGDPLNRGETL